MQHAIPEDELVDVQIAAHNYLAGMNNVNTHWLQTKLMEAFVAGAKYQYQEERDRKAKKRKVPAAAWYGIVAWISILLMPFHQDEIQLTCLFTLSLLFSGMMLLAFLIEEKSLR